MLDVCICGTGGTMPLKNRHLASALFRLCGRSVLIDCGEGTQIALKEAGFTFKPVDVICFTHFHADHISGLPGLLLTMGNEGREDDVEIIGPVGLCDVVNSLKVIAPGLPFRLKFTEIKDCAELCVSGFKITARRLAHNIPCLGYRLDIPRAGKFDIERAKKLPVPVNMWGRLQKGETVEYEGVVYEPSSVLGEDRRGISVAYCTDSRPCDNIQRLADGVDLFICEGMFGDMEKLERAEKTGHMMMTEAADIARASGVGKLILTHFSPSLQTPEDYLDTVREIFPESYTGFDGQVLILGFKD